MHALITFQLYVLEVLDLPTKVEYDDLFGKRFEPGAVGPDAYDCYTLCAEIRTRAGKELSLQETLWAEDFRNIRLRHALITEGKKRFVQLEGPEPFCLVCFKLRPPYVTHMGVVLADCRQFIHITKKTGITVESITKDPWLRKIDGFYEHIS